MVFLACRILNRIQTGLEEGLEGRRRGARRQARAGPEEEGDICRGRARRQAALAEGRRRVVFDHSRARRIGAVVVVLVTCACICVAWYIMSF